MEYRVSKNLLGKHLVHYQCPHCRFELNSRLDEAGLEFNCPTCGNLFVTPGKAELLKFKVAEAERSEHEERLKTLQQLERQQKEERKRQREVESQKKSAIQERRRQEEAAQEEQEKLNALDKTSFGDRVLDWAFKFGKGASILVIASCSLAALICAILLLTVHAESFPIVQSPGAPTFAEYKREAEPLAAAPVNPVPSDVPGTQYRTLDDRYAAILKQFNLDPTESSLALWQVDVESQEAFVTGLESFAADVAKTTSARDSSVISWYVSDFKSRLTAYTEAERRRKDDQIQAEAEAASKRASLGIAIGVAFAAMMAFLFLPLAIQIERNTRHTLELQAAIRKENLKVADN
jgi:Zn-finger nucleic acid-binding protein